MPIWLSNPSVGDGVRDGHDAGVVHQDVDAVHTVGELPHRRQILQVELANLDVAGHLPGGGFTLAAVAHRQDHLSADAGELAGSHRAQSTVGSGDDDGAAGERGQVCGGPRRHGKHSSAAPLPSYFAATVKPRMIVSTSTASATRLVGQAGDRELDQVAYRRLRRRPCAITIRLMVCSRWSPRL